jgi:predicted dienelactone hydrolase
MAVANKCAVATIASWLVSASGCTSGGNEAKPDSACSACPTTHNVGYQELIFTDSTRGRKLKTAIWYPTSDGPAGSTNDFNNGRPDTSGQPYPLILFSHGSSGTNQQASFLTREWTRHGFVVAAPDHEKNTWRDDDPDSLAMMHFARPRDIRFVVDQMLVLNQDPGSFLRGMIDPASIGMTGSSFGGQTTLLIAGATPNLDYLAEYCQAHPEGWDICPLQDEIQALYPGQRVIDESDPRIRAAVSIVPDGYPWFHQDGMAKIKTPIMIIAGGRDTIHPLNAQQKPLYEAISSTKYLFIQDDADHVSNSYGCGVWEGTPPAGCSTLQAQMVLATTDFWMLYLKSDLGCGEGLRTCVPFLPGVELLSEAGP